MAKKQPEKEEDKHGLQEDGTYFTTKNDYEKYKAESQYWVAKFGLHDVEYIVTRDQTDNNARAQCWIKAEDCISKSILQKEWSDGEPYPGEVEKCAFHEVMEILLSELWILGERRFLSEDEYNRARHRIIRRFENCIWKDDWAKRSGK